MRFRKLAGIAAGALTAGLLTVPALTGTAHAAAPTFECKYQTWDLPFNPTITAVGVDGRVDINMSAFPEIQGPPAFVTVSNVIADVTATYGGQEIALTGSQAISPATPMASGFAVPTMSAQRPGTTNGGQLTITGFGLTATAMGGQHPIACTLPAPVVVNVTPEAVKPPVVAPVVKAAKTKSVTKVKLAKKGKKATVTTTVKAGKKKATGKVTITVKKGKKTVAKKTVKLKNGKAKLVLKKGKLKAKGKYVVKAKFKGSKKFKKSSAKKASFKIKK